MVRLKIIDLFSGAGGLSEGFIQTGRFEAIGAVELNPAARKTYIMNHGGNKDIIIKEKGSTQSNITEINFKEYIESKCIDPSELIILGGPPCQGFSNANRQKNYLISGNNQLVKEFVRAIDEIRPKAFVMENVKAIESVKHKFFVTNTNEDSDYSSEKHLREITDSANNNSSENQLWKRDIIILLESKYVTLQPVIANIIQENYDMPVIKEERMISRLRVIEKEYIQKSRSKSHSLKSEDEIRDLIKHLMRQFLDKDINRLGIDLVIEEALKGLRNILDGKLDFHDVKSTIGPLIDINNLLLHIRELNDEGIDNIIEIDVKDPLKVNAIVKSYNVVEYLKCVFKHYNYNIDSGLLTASDFGVPQKRNRFVIIGTQATPNKPKLPKRKLKKAFNTRDAISDLSKVSPESNMKKYKAVDYPKDEMISNPLQKYFRTGSDKLHNHINTDSDELSLKRFEEIKKTEGKNFHSLSNEMKNTYTDASRTQNTIYLRLNYDEPSPTVVNIRKSMWNHPENAVALSIREAARLQSFRDNFIFYGTKDQQYQQVGNAVPPLMARAIAESILETLDIEPEETLAEELGEVIITNYNKIEVLI